MKPRCWFDRSKESFVLYINNIGIKSEVAQTLIFNDSNDTPRVARLIDSYRPPASFSRLYFIEVLLRSRVAPGAAFGKLPAIKVQIWGHFCMAIACGEISR